MADGNVLKRHWAEVDGATPGKPKIKLFNLDIYVARCGGADYFVIGWAM